jgi:hypothetical protein
MVSPYRESIAKGLKTVKKGRSGLSSFGMNLLQKAATIARESGEAPHDQTLRNGAFYSS